MQQATIAEPVMCRGIGLHSGSEVEVRLRPMEADFGIRFLRTDSGRTEIPASLASVQSTRRATTLARGEGGGVGTVEHLLATFYALGIDNVEVEVSGPEMPAMDGSARPLLDWVRTAGRNLLGRPRTEVEIVETHEIRTPDSLIRISPTGPNSGLTIDYAIEFSHRCIGRQRLKLPKLDEAVFEREVAGARTFGFEKEVKALRDAGLGLGGSFENTIVLGEEGVLNPEPLRWKDEFVRHKVLDLVGDLALFGAPLHGHVEVEKGGHAVHHALLCAMQDRPSLWTTHS